MNEFSILCFGDSNTYGQDSRRGRWPSGIRWTRRLQSVLGPSFYVIEEGLSGRTVDLGEGEEQRFNGRRFLRPCLESHEPIDLAIIMLGTNDLRPSFQRTPDQIAGALGNLVDDVRAFGKNSKGQAPPVLLMSPAPIHAKAEHFTTVYSSDESDEAAKKSEQLAACIQLVASERGCDFLDVGSIARVGDDGLHLDQLSHKALADTLEKIIARHVVAKDTAGR